VVVERGDEAVYNVASGRAVAVRQVAQALVTLSNVEGRIERDQGLVRSSDAARIVGDATRLRRRLGWQPTIQLETTLADVIASAQAEREEAGSPCG